MFLACVWFLFLVLQKVEKNYAFEIPDVPTQCEYLEVRYSVSRLVYMLFPHCPCFIQLFMFRLALILWEILFRRLSSPRCLLTSRGRPFPTFLEPTHPVWSTFSSAGRLKALAGWISSHHVSRRCRLLHYRWKILLSLTLFVGILEKKIRWHVRLCL